MKETKRYSAREAVRRPDDVGTFALAATSGFIDEASEIFEDYIEISRKRVNNKLALANLQLQILTDLLMNEEALRQCKEGIAEKEKEALKEGETDVIALMKRSAYCYGLIVNAIKCVADGIAWRAFDHDRALLHILSSKESSGSMANKEGLAAELQVWVEAADDEKALLNDLTNFLRVGDVTVFHEGGDVEFVHLDTIAPGSYKVKSGRRQRSARIRRQRERLLETVEFLNTGIGNLDGTTVKLLTIDIPIKSHLGILQNLIRTARGKGFASELFGEYLIVQVMDFKRIDDFDRVKRELDAKHNSIRKKWKSNNDTLVPLDSFSTLDFSRNLAPFSIFPFAPKDCADILFGRIHIRGELNLSEIMRLYVSYGWRIKDTLFDRVNRSSEALLRKGDSLFTIEKGKFTLEVPVSLVGRVAREGLHPKILIDVAESFYKAGPQAGISGFFPNFLKEGTQWR